MGTFFVYILKSSVCLALFYLFYRLLLSKETFHRFNRIALLGILFLSLLLPFIEVTTSRHTEVSQTMLTLEQQLLLMDDYPLQDSGRAVGADAIEAYHTTLSGIHILLFIYIAGILFFACRNLYSLFRLFMLLRSGRKEKMSSGIRLIVHQKEIAPFSWMKYIVISEKDLKENGREILIHEMAHIRNRHSLDLLVADVCIFFQWFNPAVWLLKQELQNIHEYEADKTVITEGIDAKQYQLLLIKKAVGTRLYSMSNSFNHSSLKKRITMMLKEKSNPWARLKYLYVLPLAAIAVTAFARPEISGKIEEISAVKVNDLAAIVEAKVQEKIPLVVNNPEMPGDSLTGKIKKVSTPSGEKVFTVVEQMPEYQGGMKNMIKYLEDNMKYPEEAKLKGTQGRVIVQCIIDKEGNVTSPSIARPVAPELDEEALRLVEAMPKWTPGMQKGKPVATKYTIPVTFRLGNSSDRTDALLGGTKPLIIIDGKEVTYSTWGAINSDWVKSITILKDEGAKALYGEKGKDGVVVVTLKTQEEYDNDIKSAQPAIAPSPSTADGEIRVKGKVLDLDGKPVTGASVLIEGTNRGTIADLDGVFIISAPKGSVLQISFIEKQTSKVKVENTDPLVITLQND